MSVFEAVDLQAVAADVVMAVADGRDSAEAIGRHVNVVEDVEPLLAALERAGLVTGEWIERPGEMTRRRYQLTSAGHMVATRTLRP